MAEHIPDADFRDAFVTQIDNVYEVHRRADGAGYWSLPAFLGNARWFGESEWHVLATLVGHERGQPVRITVEIVSGMISGVGITGQQLRPPHRIEMTDLGVPTVSLPVPGSVPEVTGWVQRLCDAGILAPGRMPLDTDERQRLIRECPGLPADYVEFCSQTDGGTILPDSADYAILSLRDIGPRRVSGYGEFIPLVDMRELGGLGCRVAQTPQPVMEFTGPKPSFFAKTFQAAIRRVAREETA